MLPLHPIKLAHTPPHRPTPPAPHNCRGPAWRGTSANLVSVSTNVDGYQVTGEVELIASSLSAVSTAKGIAHTLDRQNVNFVLQSRPPKR